MSFFSTRKLHYIKLDSWSPIILCYAILLQTSIPSALFIQNQKEYHCFNFCNMLGFEIYFFKLYLWKTVCKLIQLLCTVTGHIIRVCRVYKVLFPSQCLNVETSPSFHITCLFKSWNVTATHCGVANNISFRILYSDFIKILFFFLVKLLKSATWIIPWDFSLKIRSIFISYYILQYHIDNTFWNNILGEDNWLHCSIRHKKIGRTLSRSHIGCWDLVPQEATAILTIFQWQGPILLWSIENIKTQFWQTHFQWNSLGGVHICIHVRQATVPTSYRQAGVFLIELLKCPVLLFFI